MTADPRAAIPPQLTAAEVGQLVARHPDWWEAAQLGTQTEGVPLVALLGRGESFVAWSVQRPRPDAGAAGPGPLTANGPLPTDAPPTAADPGLAIRIPHRPVAELQLSLTAELDVLRRLPAGLGARPVTAHEPTVDDPTAYLVTTLVPGTPRPGDRWTDGLLAALARQLARLHVHGVTAGLQVPDRHDPVQEAHAARGWWRDHEPVAARTLERLWPAFLRHQEACAPAFAQAEGRLVHGDVALTNVLVTGTDDDPQVHLIDWEWWHVGDPARDLAFAGGQVGDDRLYARLSEERIRRQAEVYVAERDRLGAPVDLEPLLVRRAAHLAHEVYFVSAHFERVAAAGGPQAAGYAKAAAQLRDGLHDWLT